jgi:hypothetical protein
VIIKQIVRTQDVGNRTSTELQKVITHGRLCYSDAVQSSGYVTGGSIVLQHLHSIVFLCITTTFHNSYSIQRCKKLKLSP